MSFAALDHKFLIVIDNYASYKSGKPCDLFTTFSFIIPIFHRFLTRFYDFFKL